MIQHTARFLVPISCRGWTKRFLWTRLGCKKRWRQQVSPPKTNGCADHCWSLAAQQRFKSPKTSPRGFTLAPRAPWHLWKRHLWTRFFLWMWMVSLMWESRQSFPESFPAVFFCFTSGWTSVFLNYFLCIFSILEVGGGAPKPRNLRPIWCPHFVEDQRVIHGPRDCGHGLSGLWLGDGLQDLCAGQHPSGTFRRLHDLWGLGKSRSTVQSFGGSFVGADPRCGAQMPCGFVFKLAEEAASEATAEVGRGSVRSPGQILHLWWCDTTDPWAACRGSLASHQELGTWTDYVEEGDVYLHSF